MGVEFFYRHQDFTKIKATINIFLFCLIFTLKSLFLFIFGIHFGRQIKHLLD